MPFGIGGKEGVQRGGNDHEWLLYLRVRYARAVWVVNQFFGGEGHMPEDEPVCFTKMKAYPVSGASGLGLEFGKVGLEFFQQPVEAVHTNSHEGTDGGARLLQAGFGRRQQWRADQGWRCSAGRPRMPMAGESVSVSLNVTE